MITTLARTLFLALAAATLALLPGCSFRSAAAEGRAALAAPPAPAEAWPARETSLLADMVDATPQTLTMAFPMSVLVDGKLTTVNWMHRVRIADSGVYGRGIIRTLVPLSDEGDVEDEAEQDLEFGGLQFVSLQPDDAAYRVASIARSEQRTDQYQRLLLRRLGIRQRGGNGAWYLQRQGTRMRLFEPDTSPPRGLVLHLSSLAGLDYERPVIDILTKAGWLVLQIDASTARRRESPVRIADAADIDAAAKRLARSIDNRVAEVAYAAQAGMEYLCQQRPELDSLPVVITGYSAGALVGPAAGVLLHDRISALVLAGGGANLLSISHRSSLTNGGIRIEWAQGLESPDAWSRLEAAYLAESRLDPYSMAPSLQDRPVLLLHGMFDDIVPADTGDLLYERLGRPERLVYTLGHRGLFWRLPSQAGMIERWLEQTTQSRVAPRSLSTLPPTPSPPRETYAE